MMNRFTGKESFYQVYDEGKYEKWEKWNGYLSEEYAKPFENKKPKTKRTIKLKEKL